MKPYERSELGEVGEGFRPIDQANPLTHTDHMFLLFGRDFTLNIQGAKKKGCPFARAALFEILF
jgi:hypothetical protein